MQGIWKKVAAGAIIAVVAPSALVPSIAINVAHALNSGGHPAMLALAIMSVVAAPVCLMALPALRTAKRHDLLAGALILFALSLAFNLTNAIGLAGGTRDSLREDRQAQIAKISRAQQRLQQVKSDLDRHRSMSGDATPEMVDAELLGLRADPIFKRSAECTNVTLPDSKAHCRRIAEALTRKGAAERLAALEAERKELTAELAAWGGLPTAADPKIDRLASLLGLAFTIGKDGRRWIGIALDLNAAMLVEFMAAFLPAIAAALLWVAGNEALRAPALPRSAVQSPGAVSLCRDETRPRRRGRASSDDRMIAEERILLFAGERLRPGGETVGADVNAAARVWWTDRYPGVPAPSRNVVAKVLTEAGIVRQKRGGKIRYGAALVS